jgi:hypothetical protein
MGQTWAATLRVIDIINKLPEFVSDYYKQLKEGTLVLVGSYFLGEKYDLTLFDSAMICKKLY